VGVHGLRGVDDQAPFFGVANLTTADIMMVYCLTTSRAFRGTSIDDYPNLKAYLERIGGRPAYRRGDVQG
jgi:glutathione S-transferase